MKIALAQLNYTIGDFEGNVGAIIHNIQKAHELDADLIVFSELAVCGYPPLDLLEHKNFIEKCDKAVDKIVRNSEGIAVIVGAPRRNLSKKGKNLYNSALFINNGKLVKEVHKTLLPTYDIFDEYRYFQPAESRGKIEFKGKKIALTICEDLWYKQPILTDFGKDKLYNVNPMDNLVTGGCDFIINIAASPFAYNHDDIKNEILRYNAMKYSLPVYYVNQIGAQTELIFDGASRILNTSGNVIHRLPAFKEDISFYDTDRIAANRSRESLAESSDETAKIHDALVLGIRDYFRKMNFSKAILGLSGGIDSAVTLLLASRALGADNVRVLLMPSQYSSEHSVTDAIELANKLQVKYDIINIKNIFNQFLTDLEPVFKDLPHDIAEENIQARIRGNLLMALSNKFGNLLLNTSNKSEAAVGYGTLYGDMSGGLSVLGDVYKTDVYRLARYVNRKAEIIPNNTIEKPPSAELRPDQKDSDSLPDYEILDKILFNYIELRKSIQEIIEQGFDKGLVEKSIRMVNTNEYKRFQTPPILRISSKAFGLGRRMPLVAKYQ
ncbi:MAG: NAD+ synthase [Bacteroidales bacterium]|nr:NAD+ synthase [Bacteroidales bacterium]